jgi:hypothetical protein
MSAAWYRGRHRQTCRSHAILVTAGVIAFSSPLFAASPVQDPPPLEARPLSLQVPLVPVPASNLATLDRQALDTWVREYREWQDWATRWRGRVEPGWFAARDRKQKPDPPAWLPGLCAQPLDDRPSLVEACALLDDWGQDYLLTASRQQAATARSQHEDPTKTMWWEHIHVDALWPIMQSRGTAYGMFGTHITMDVAGRFQVFVAPGFIMLSASSDARREWTPATDWGFAYRLGSFRFPASTQKAALHVNVARAWILSGGAALFKSSVDLVGLSFTFSQRDARR